MVWVDVKSFLERFRDFKPPNEFVKDEAMKAIRGILGAQDLALRNLEIEQRGGVLYIKTKDAALRNQIFTRKDQILEELSKKLGNRIKEIYF